MKASTLRTALLLASLLLQLCPQSSFADPLSDKLAIKLQSAAELCLIEVMNAEFKMIPVALKSIHASGSQVNSQLQPRSPSTINWSSNEGDAEQILKANLTVTTDTKSIKAILNPVLHTHLVLTSDETKEIPSWFDDDYNFHSTPKIVRTLSKSITVYFDSDEITNSETQEILTGVSSGLYNESMNIAAKFYNEQSISKDQYDAESAAIDKLYKQALCQKTISVSEDMK